VYHTGKKWISERKPPIIYLAECEHYTDDKTCVSSNILFSCPFNLKSRRVGKSLKGKLFSQKLFAFLSLDKMDKAAVISVTEMSPLFPAAPPHVLSALGHDC